jgi:ubiquinone/menaquinone biosynthesis C-methylase UbiE
MKVDQQQKYDDVGNFFDYLSGIFERGIINRAVDLLDIKKSDSFLDVACGTGKVMIYASKKTNKLCGCDFSNTMINVAKKRLKKLKVSAKLDVCDITKKLPYKDKSFDKINFSVTLGMINPKEYQKVFLEIKRTLKKKGQIVVTEYTTKKKNIFTNMLEWEHKICPKFQDCIPVNVEQILIKNGFKIIKPEIKNCFGFKFEVVLAEL